MKTEFKYKRKLTAEFCFQKHAKYNNKNCCNKKCMYKYCNIISCPQMMRQINCNNTQCGGEIRELDKKRSVLPHFR